MTDFHLRPTPAAVRIVTEQALRVPLSERDSLRLLDVLENPSLPNTTLLSAARRLPKRPFSFVAARKR